MPIILLKAAITLAVVFVTPFVRQYAEGLANKSHGSPEPA
jgi:hypothetical protein